MQLYSTRPARRVWQITADLVAVTMIVVSILVASVVRETILALQAFGVQMEESGETFAKTMSDAAEGLGKLPLVGSSLGSPFADASDAAQQLADAGRQEQEAVQTVAISVSTAVWLLPVIFLLLVWLIPRLRFVFRSRETARTLGQLAGRDMLALRAIVNQPLEKVVSVVPDPLAAIRTSDSAALDALARLELRSQGVRIPKSARSPQQPPTSAVPPSSPAVPARPPRPQ